jgi:hypothetical protein
MEGLVGYEATVWPVLGMADMDEAGVSGAVIGSNTSRAIDLLVGRQHSNLQPDR